MRAKIWFVLAGLLIGLSIARNAQSGSGSGRDDGEFLIDTSITHVPDRFNQCYPSVAFDGENYLVVWYDRRGVSWDIYGARVTRDGVVLDPSGIAISTVARHQRFPAVAFGGDKFFVVWADDSCGICGARVTRDGRVLDPEGISISFWGDCVALAFDGTNFLVVWQDYRNSTSDIYGARVTPEGVVLDPQGIPLSTAVGSQRLPAVAFDGTNFLVVWQDYRNSASDIYGARVTPEGVVLDPEGFYISHTLWYCETPPAAVAFDGTNFLVVWEDHRNGNIDIYGARVTPEGVVLDPEGIPISTAEDHQYDIGVAFDGTNFFVVWQDWRSGYRDDIYGARVTPEGVVLDTSGIVLSTAGDWQHFPAVAFGGTNYLVVWEDWRSGWGDIYSVRVTPDGGVLDSTDILISSAPDNQWSPATAFDGTNFFVVWQDWRNGASNSEIYGARVTPEGVLLDPQGVPISTAAGDQVSPAVAFDGTNFLVVWQDYRSGSYFPEIYGARVTPGGVVLDPEGILISTGADDQGSPAVAFDGTNFLVVWEHGGIYGARVTPGGVVLDPEGIPISTGAHGQGSPAVAFDGTNYLVVWEYGNGGDIYGARVTPGGVVLDPEGIPISTAPNSEGSPAVAFDGTNYLVVWEYERGYINTCGARVTPEGVVLDSEGIPISTGAGDQKNPAVAFDGTNYLVVWEDSRIGGADIYGAWVRPDGTVFDEGPVVRQDGNQWSPALCRGPGTQMLLTYEGWTGTVGGKTYNAYRIWGKVNPSPGVQEVAEEPVRTRSYGPTIIRGVLMLKETGVKAKLLDAAGRRVMELLPGANDVRGIAPGVYFICGGSGVHRVVVAR